MSFGVKYGEKYEFYKALQDRGESSPLDDLPDLDIVDTLYYEDFVVLGTERVNGMSMGPIPIMKIVDYARMEGVEDVGRFKRIIAAVDRLYMRLVAVEQERKSKAAKKKSNSKMR
ncbi:MAG: hypothetical protein DRJ65_19860 [Acidobacteria bacterium]|nr:MAG: hypothetical protein DRJ65_19860 [Acidobacteriota bacterium]